MLKGQVCVYLYQTTYVIECHVINVLTQVLVMRHGGIKNKEGRMTRMQTTMQT